MASTTLPLPPANFGFYPILVSKHNRQDISTLSPISVYSPQEDFGTDSAASPSSPTSPVFTNPYQLPTGGDWINWEDDSKPADFFKSEPFEPDLSSVPRRTLTASPAVNPMELSNPVQAADDVPFGQDGLNDDNQPLFSNPQPDDSQNKTMTTAYPPPPPPPAVAVKTSPSTSIIPMSDVPPPRYPSRKRKSKSSSSSREESHSARSSLSPAPAPTPGAGRRMGNNSSNNATAPKKTTHNMIEKRYRTNLNDKIAALRDSVPALRIMVHKLDSSSQQGQQGGGGGGGSSEEADGEDVMMMVGGGVEGREDLGGLAPAHKLNKATILSKATEYIAHLERRNQALAKENAALRSRVEGFEMLVMSRGGAGGVWS